MPLVSKNSTTMELMSHIFCCLRTVVVLDRARQREVRQEAVAGAGRITPGEAQPNAFPAGILDYFNGIRFSSLLGTKCNSDRLSWTLTLRKSKKVSFGRI